MDSITSQSSSESPQRTRATRMLPMEAGQGVHLIATCLLNAQTSQMSYKIRKVLKHDFERKCPRFVIANPGRIVGIPLRWMIRPGTEHQLRRCFRGPPPPRRPIPQFYGGLSQVIHCILCKRGFDGQESFVTHQREAHSRGATVSPTIHKRAAVTHSTGAGPLGAPRAVHYRDELTNHVIGAESATEAETEFAVQQDIRSSEVEEKSLFVDEMPIATDGSENRRDEGELDDAQIFEGAASRQISDDKNSPVDSILIEVQGDDRKHYIIRGLVTVKMSPNESTTGYRG
ncbi:hypothetical protein BKA61DRAFT_740376 [Leptodontidium sp. MPI-SDFR-AT-0119]|nr:hypothetical protein BKA61DRAFT_740376 [Leptodontidium sp. MPI-SDFR-AT-0119]